MSPHFGASEDVLG